MLFGLLGSPSDAYSGYKANTSGLDSAAADAKKWGKKSDGLSKAGLVQQQQLEADKASNAMQLGQQADSNLATSQSMNRMFGGNAVTANTLNNQDESQRGDMLSSNDNMYSRMMDGLNASDYAMQDYRDYDVNTNVLPDIEVKKGDLRNKVAMGKAQGNAMDNAGNKKMGSTIGSVAGLALTGGNPLGMMAGGMLGGMLG